MSRERRPQRLLNLGNYQSIRIVTAAEMLGILKV